MRIHGRASAAVLTGILVGAIGLCGCGGTNYSTSAATVPPERLPPSPQAKAAVERAVASTLGLTSDFAMTFSKPSSNGTSATPRDATGAVDFQSPSGTIRIDLPGATGGTEKMVFLPGTVFIKPPPSSPSLQAGKPWIFANFADIAKYKVNFPPYIVQTESINPAFPLYELSWGLSKAASAGQSSFEGQQAESYLVTVNLNQALARATGPAGDVFSHALSSEISANGGNTVTPTASITMEVWIDGSARLVGARVAPPGAGIGTLTLSLQRFGATVHTDKPPRALVVDIAAMIPGGEQEALNGGDTDGA